MRRAEEQQSRPKITECATAVQWSLEPTKRVHLPLEELPKRRVLDPVEADDGLRGQSALEQRLNVAVILCRFRERHHLVEESEMSRGCRESNTRKLKFKPKKKMTLYPRSGTAFLSQLGGTVSDEAELELKKRSIYQSIQLAS